MRSEAINSVVDHLYKVYIIVVRSEAINSVVDHLYKVYTLCRYIPCLYVPDM